MMPRGAPRYVCHWCRVGFKTYPELTRHHDDCKAKPSNKTPEAAQTVFHCPHEACDCQYTSFESLQSHLNHCPVISKAADFADALWFRDDIDSEAARELRNADFEKWCREHGREA